MFSPDTKFTDAGHMTTSRDCFDEVHCIFGQVLICVILIIAQLRFVAKYNAGTLPSLHESSNYGAASIN